MLDYFQDRLSQKNKYLTIIGTEKRAWVHPLPVGDFPLGRRVGYLLQVVKDIVGQRRELEQLKTGEFFGEIPILLGSADIVSVLAVSRSRLARFDRQQLQELIRDSSSSGTAIFRTMSERLSMAPQYVMRIIGGPHQKNS